jgi:hypothetical protein
MKRDGPTAHDRIDKIDSHLQTHEAVCAERWKETILRIKRLELILITCSGAVILLLAEIALNR